MKGIEGQSFIGKTILLRVDFNVPVKDERILDDSRIKVALSTILYLLKSCEKLVLISHLGRPTGRNNARFKLKRVASHLSDLLKIRKAVKKVKIKNFLGYQISPKIFLLENIRFYKEEEKNDLRFAKKLASLGNVYVNDAFSVSHREHASTEGITRFLPSFAGFELQKEFTALSRLIKNPKKPFICILGGAKVSDKIEIIKSLAKKVDWFLLGGAMASTFLASMDINLKDSLIAKDKINIAVKIWKKFGEKIILPSQVIFGHRNNKTAILDIGESEVKKFSQYLKDAKTIFWNGTLGKTEIPKYSKSSNKLAQIIAVSKAFTVVAGGDTIAFLNNLKLLNKFSYVSYGGGASLEFLSGKKFKSLTRLF